MADPLTPQQREKLNSLCDIQGPGPLIFALLGQQMAFNNKIAGLSPGLTPEQTEKLNSLCKIQGPAPLLFALLEQTMIGTNLFSGGGGGGTTPGGSDTQVQFNDGGTFGGANLSWDKTNDVLGFGGLGSMNSALKDITGHLSVRLGDDSGYGPFDSGFQSIHGQADVSALSILGATQTASHPALNVSQTWNNGGVLFTCLKVNITNTASNDNSLLMDLQGDSASAFKVDQFGNTTIGRGGQLIFGGAGASFSSSQLTIGSGSYNFSVATSIAFTSPIINFASQSVTGGTPVPGGTVPIQVGGVTKHFIVTESS